MRWKRPLFLFHRWAGIVLCAFFALWFASGIFMMYVEFPQQTKPERLAGSARLNFSTATLAPAAALARLWPRDFTTRATPSAIRSIDIEPFASAVMPRAIRLTMILDRPAYVVHPENGAQPRVVFADTGEVLHEVDARTGERSVLDFAAHSGWIIDPARVELERAVQTDQWSVSSSLNDHRPLLRFALNDANRTVLYVSSRTAEVVRDTRARERALNYFGAVTHWLYPTVIRKYPLLWEWIVDILSAAGVLLAISGLWIGWLRWNRHAKPGKPAIPYRGLMRWHYFAGIAFGVVTVTWVVSGLLSMNPLNLNPSRRPDTNQALLFSGKELAAADFELPREGFGPLAREAELIHYAGQPFYRVTDRTGATRLVAGASVTARLPDSKALLALAPKLLPDASVVEASVLRAYDNYYYTRHPERGERALPVIRVRFDDTQHTWFHIDPITGQILERSTRTNRVYRWLYNGLHSWDIWWLWQRRPLWDICVIAFSLGGFALSSLGVVIGWRRLRYKQRRIIVADRPEVASTAG